MSLLTVEAFKVHFTPLESQLNIGQQQPFFPSAFVALLVIHSGDSFCQLVFLMVLVYIYCRTTPMLFSTFDSCITYYGSGTCSS